MANTTIDNNTVKKFVSGISGSNADSYVKTANMRKAQLEKAIGLPVEFIKDKNNEASADYVAGEKRGTGKIRVYVNDDMAKADKDNVAKQLTTSLNHELRHNTQYSKSGKKGDGSHYQKGQGKIDSKKYYQDEDELDALAPEIVDDLKDEIGITKLKHISTSELKKNVDKSNRLSTISKEGGSSSLSKLTKSIKDVAKDLKETTFIKSIPDGEGGDRYIDYQIDDYEVVDIFEDYLKEYKDKENSVAKAIEATEQYFHTLGVWNADENFIKEVLSKYYEDISEGPYGTPVEEIQDFIKYCNRNKAAMLCWSGLVDDWEERKSDASDLLGDALWFQKIKNNLKGDFKMKESIYKRIQEEAQEDVPEIVWNWLEQNGLDPANGNFNIDDETDFYFESKPILDKYGKERTKEYRFIKGEYEADSVAKSYILDTLDDIGISGFNIDISDFVDEDWFESAIRESYEFYVDDIANESSSDPDFETRLEQEMAEKGVDSPEELVDYLVDQAGPDYIEAYKNDFGESEFNTIVKNNNLIDEDELVDYVLNQDGRGSTISGYDGVEIELDDEWFAYRTN
jgi:hypothetical protein